MARYRGPCQDCGEAVDRVIRPERPRCCLECAIRRTTDYAYAMHRHTHPHIQRCYQEGDETRRQIMVRNGPRYEKWREKLYNATAEHEDA